jgi:Ca2+-binding EF-hand superfamily protein
MNKFLIAGAAAAIAAAAHAQQGQPTPQAGQHQPNFMNKTETRADVSAHVQKMFARLDTNHDGYITKAEIDAMEAQHKEKVEQRAAAFDPNKAFDRLDTNHDGKITQAEVDAAHAQRMQAKGGKAAPLNAHAGQKLFARVDTNKDGVITRAEFDAGASQMHAHMEQAEVRRGGMADHMFDAADANHDGKVSLAEMQTIALQHFDKADLNHDGTVTPQERQQARQQLRTQHKPS